VLVQEEKTAVEVADEKLRVAEANGKVLVVDDDDDGERDGGDGQAGAEGAKGGPAAARERPRRSRRGGSK